MIKKDINFIRDIALEQESSAPLNAFRLMSLVRKRRPNGRLINKKHAELRRKLLSLHIPGDNNESRKSLILFFCRHTVAFLRNVFHRFSDNASVSTLTIMEFEALAKTALALEKCDPMSSYKLCRLIKTYHPVSRLINGKEIELREKLFGYMLTAREDGTTERLNAVVIGSVIATTMEIPFRFSWATEVGAVRNSLSSVSNQLPDFFRTDFVNKFYINFEEMKKYQFTGISIPQCEFCSSLRLNKPITVAKKEKALSKYLNFSPSVRISSKLSISLKCEIANAFRNILSDDYLNLLPNFQATLGHFLGIHYRGGDVIYGDYRHGQHAVGGKSAPMPIIEDLINNHKDKNILLFGTPIGDTQRDLEYLNDKYSNVYLSTKFSNHDHDLVIQDSMMMSCCDSLIAYSRTGVARLAALFNPTLSRTSFEDIYSNEDFYRLCLENIENDNYNPIQRSYINVRALALSDELAVAQGTKDLFISNIQRLDPENRMRWLHERQAKSI